MLEEYWMSAKIQCSLQSYAQKHLSCRCRDLLTLVWLVFSGQSWRISKNIVKMEKVQKIGVMWGGLLIKGLPQLRGEATSKKSFNFHLFWFGIFKKKNKNTLPLI